MFVCSLSCRTIVYKALLTGPQLPEFFADLRHPAYQTAIAVFHQRYSTNTRPSWPLAQPFRLLGAQRGDQHAVGQSQRDAGTRAAAGLPAVGAAVERLKPVIWADGSDSASLDNALELLVRSGRDPGPRAHDAGSRGAGRRRRRAIPTLRAFYEYHECLIEPWDGPAALAITDGMIADRGGGPQRPPPLPVQGHP